jgi:hypothetical protein
MSKAKKSKLPESKVRINPVYAKYIRNTEQKNISPSSSAMHSQIAKSVNITTASHYLNSCDISATSKKASDIITVNCHSGLELLQRSVSRKRKAISNEPVRINPKYQKLVDSNSDR